MLDGKVPYNEDLIKKIQQTTPDCFEEFIFCGYMHPLEDVNNKSSNIYLVHNSVGLDRYRH